MSGIQTKNGKAFEYACLLAIYNALAINQEVVIEKTQALMVTEKAYYDMTDDMQSKLIAAANAAVRVVINLEPQLKYHGKNIPLYLSIQADIKGQAGDVRDLLCIRKQNEWEIGLSCKHNHRAFKHSRLSTNLDFGEKWFGIPCSQEYFNNISPVFGELNDIRKNSNKSMLWRELKNVHERFYIPVLQAFLDELRRLDSENRNLLVPKRLIQYLVGRNDFYKVITIDRKRVTRIEAINILGTLNRPAAGNKSLISVPRLKLPTQFFRVDLKTGSKTTATVACDEGWEVSMRIHNGDSDVKPSLKFDVNLVSLPNSIHTQVEAW